MVAPNAPTETRRQFPLGKIVATPGVLQAFEKNKQLPAEFIARHATGDWGDCTTEDQYANEKAIKHGDRLFSVYHLNDKTKIWIITEAANDQGQRASTCLLLPDEY
jgi:hypothetical protein